MLNMYKPGQGYWVRMMTFIGGMLLFIWGGFWLAGQLTKIDIPKDADGVTYVIEPRLVQAMGGGVVLIVGALLSYWVAFSSPRACEFFIATESEMRKVNWSSRREVVGSTLVVITLSFLLAVVIFVVDLGFSKFFQAVGLLHSTG